MSTHSAAAQCVTTGTYHNIRMLLIADGANGIKVLEMNEPPQFTAHPQSQAIPEGNPVTFAATVTGATSYQWKKNGTNIVGATANTFNIGSVVPADAGSYIVTVGNSAGSLSSTPATLTVAPAPTPPTVALSTTATAPFAPATVPLVAAVADLDGTVTKVEFFQGVIKLGERIVAPFVFDAINLAAGTYVFTAKATDNDNKTTTSAPLNVSVAIGPQAGLLQFSQVSYSVAENVGTATITVTRTGGSDGSVSVQYATGIGGATPGADYQPTSGTLTWAAGVSTPQTFPITLLADTAVEGDEVVPLTLSNPTGGAALGPQSTAPLVITDNQNVATATHSAPGYAGGSTTTISVQVTYTGTLIVLGYEMTLPAGWKYVSDTTTGSASQPRVNDQGTLSWLWFNPDTIPASPARFTVQVSVPAGESGPRSLTSAGVVGLPSGDQLQVTASPNPLVLSNLPAQHSADTDKNWQLSLQELVRVVLLRNTYRNGNNELTGEYHLVNPNPALGSDGYAPGPGDQSGRPHSADTDKNWQLSLQELVRVVLLRNTYRNANNELTGEYHLVNPTPALGSDGFAPGPQPTVQPASVRPRAAAGTGKLVKPAAAVVEQATQGVVSATYQPGGTVVVTCTINHNTNLFGWQVVLPTGWSLVSETSSGLLSESGSGTADKPRANDRGTLSWLWFASPTNSPAVFTFTVLAPANATGTQIVTASAILGTADAQTRILNANTLTLTPILPGPMIHQPARLTDGSFRLLVGARDGAPLTAGDAGRFTVQATTNLTNWITLPSGFSISNGRLQLDDGDAVGLPRRFYRILEQ